MLLGTDPELFVIVNNKPVSAFEALGGDLDIELPFGVLTPDGAAVEFTVTPSGVADELTDRVAANIAATREYIRQRLPDAVLSNAPVVVFDREYIKQHPAALGKRCSLMLFGCNPDYSIYGTPPARPSADSVGIRSSGGHIHIDLSEYPKGRNIETIVTMVLDATLGLASVVGVPTEEAKQRKTLYGKAGFIRYSRRHHRLEYRVLPAVMLTHNRETTRLVFAAASEIARFAAAWTATTSAMDVVAALDINNVVRAIDTHDVDAADRVIERVATRLDARSALPAWDELVCALRAHPITTYDVGI